ncbi:MAG: DUF5317 family protein [Chloroflexi bacterium]|nr:DUF5317 family protein [Chloroflexota bacterium]
MHPSKGWAFLLALALQLASIKGQEYVPWAYPLLMGSSYGLLLVGALSNLNMWGFRFLVVGLLLNVLPMAVNHWHMPVAPDTLMAAGFHHEADLSIGSLLKDSKSVLLDRQETPFWFLTDVFPISWPKSLVFSLGDLIIVLALGLMLWSIVRTLPRRRNLER